MKKLFFLSVLVIFMIYVVRLYYREKVVDFKYNQNIYIRVKRNSTGKIEKIPFEDYIVGVVAGEMPVTFDIEALKAQAVASRSYALTKMKQNINNSYDVIDTVTNQVYLDIATLKDNWKDKYQRNISKVMEAVDETSGEYMVYDGEVVNAFFFSTSVGKTENCIEIFGGDLPYLVSVDSMWDEISPVFAYQNHYSLEEFYELLNLDYADDLDIDILDTTSTGRVKLILINNVKFTGSEIVNRLSLKSTYFKITKTDNDIYINTKGYGHGVGMSQYGAYGMAKSGYSYKDILKHYYTGVQITKM